MKRRSFLLGLGASALAAPAVVRASSLMKIWVPPTGAMISYLPPSASLLALNAELDRIRSLWVEQYTFALDGTIWTRTTLGPDGRIKVERLAENDVPFVRAPDWPMVLT